ncbi:unnamed protein product [Trichobilharzia regenti]|uniref:Transmembrane protein n=1 Tax=Trichobilharzia regenti TaxID=157069 RepID=A0A183W4H3_TRIRE|nr:unnamed protein product [Trichobilharzia regenti]VDQ03236.1 unnamed protein product [Trichobilharzia regenti]
MNNSEVDEALKITYHNSNNRLISSTYVPQMTTSPPITNLASSSVPSGDEIYVRNLSISPKLLLSFDYLQRVLLVLYNIIESFIKTIMFFFQIKVLGVESRFQLLSYLDAYIIDTTSLLETSECIGSDMGDL